MLYKKRWHFILKLRQLLNVFDGKQVGASGKRLTGFDERRSQLDELLAQQRSFLAAQLGLRGLFDSPAARVDEHAEHEQEERGHYSRQPQVTAKPDVRK